MTRSHHAKLYRTLYCGFAFAISLGSVQVAEAAKFSKFSTGVPYRSNGKTTSFGEGPNTARVPNTEVGNGQIGNTGWYRGTGAELNPATGQTLTLGANGDVYSAGVKYPFQAGYEIPASAIAGGAVALLGGPWGAALGLALAGYPYLKEWFDDAGIQREPDGSLTVPPENPDNVSDGCHARFSEYKSKNPNFGTVAGGCFGQYGGVVIVVDSVQGDGISCSVRFHCSNGTNPNSSIGIGAYDKNDILGRLPKSMDDIAPYLMRTPFNPGLLDEVIDGGGSIDLPQPNITGPSSVQGEPITTTSTGTQIVNGQPVPTRTETTTQTTYNFTTNNNQVTNTTNTTTTTTNTYNQSTGALIGTTTAVTETQPEEKDDRSECEKNPGGLACAELDTPDGEIPKAKFNVTYSIEDSWGGGSCPADVYANVGGRSIKAYDWQMTCGYVSTYVRPILLLLCAFGALLIVMPGRADS